MKKLVLLVAMATTLTACGGGVDWFPAPTPAPTGQTETTSETAGMFLSSYRNTATQEWFAETGVGTFRTYTSARFQPREPLTLETTRSGGAVTKRSLKGASETLEIKL